MAMSYKTKNAIKSFAFGVFLVGVALVVIATVWSFSAGARQRFVAGALGYTKVCVDKVTYVQFPTGTTIQRDLNDKLVPC